MPPSIEGAGVPLAYREFGPTHPARPDGSPVLLIHGSAADAEALAPVAESLADGFRVIAYDRRGYGASGAPEPYVGTTVEEQAEDAALLIRGLGAGDALLVGDGFGALVALDVVKRHEHLVRGVVLSDPPLFALVPEATEQLARQRQEIEEAVREGGPQAGVEAWLGGRVEGDALARARASYLGFFADFAGLASWPATRREIRSLAHPAVVLTGPGSPPHVIAAADRLAELLPNARRVHDGDLGAAVAKLPAGAPA